MLALLPAVVLTEPWKRLGRVALLLPGLMAGAALLTLMVSPMGWSDSRFVFGFLYATVMFEVAAAYAKDAKRRMFVALGLCIAAIVVFGQGFVSWQQVGEPDGLMQAPLQWHNQFGAFLLAPAVLAGTMFVARVGPSRSGALLVFALLGSGVVLSTSRACLGLLMLGWGLLAVHAWTREDKWHALLRWLVLPLSVVAAVLLLTSPLFFPDASYHFPLLGHGTTGGSRGPGTMAGNTAARLAYIQSALHAWSNAPWTGNGFGSFLYTGIEDVKPGLPVYATPYNLWVDAVTQGGVLFALPLAVGSLSAVGSAAVAAWRRRWQRGDQTSIATGAAIAAVLVLAHAAYDVDIDYPGCAAMLGVVCALAYSFHRRPGTPNSEQRGLSTLWSLPLIAAVLVACAGQLQDAGAAAPVKSTRTATQAESVLSSADGWFSRPSQAAVVLERSIQPRSDGGLELTLPADTVRRALGQTADISRLAPTVAANRMAAEFLLDRRPQALSGLVALASADGARHPEMVVQSARALVTAGDSTAARQLLLRVGHQVIAQHRPHRQTWPILQALEQIDGSHISPTTACLYSLATARGTEIPKPLRLGHLDAAACGSLTAPT